MKVGIYSDTHFGVYADDDRFLDYQLSVIKNIHDEYEKMGIKYVFFLGDVFDNRIRLNVKTLNKVKEFYMGEATRFEIRMLRGNHDFYNKNDSNYSSLKIFEGVENIQMIPTESGMYVAGIEGFRILFCDWIFDEQYFLKELEKFKGCSVIMGHFEMKDFEMVKGHYMKSGMDKKIFSTKELVISGHYHIADRKDNIQYLGTPYQMDWDDYGQRKYYYTFDTTKRELKEYEQEIPMFIKVKTSDEGITDITFEATRNKIVKLIIDTEEFDKDIITRIQERNPIKLTIVDNREITKEVEEEIDTSADVLTTSKEYIDKNIKDEFDKDKLFGMFSDIYKEARTL